VVKTFSRVPIFDRLMARSEYRPSPPGIPTPCLVWTGARTKFGYGNIRYQGRVVLIHRLVWELRNGPIPPGMHVLHRCDNPPCWAEGHHWLGTNAENTADRQRKGRFKARGPNRVRPN